MTYPSRTWIAGGKIYLVPFGSSTIVMSRRDAEELKDLLADAIYELDNSGGHDSNCGGNNECRCGFTAIE